MFNTQEYAEYREDLTQIVSELFEELLKIYDFTEVERFVFSKLQKQDTQKSATELMQDFINYSPDAKAAILVNTFIRDNIKTVLELSLQDEKYGDAIATLPEDSQEIYALHPNSSNIELKVFNHIASAIREQEKRTTAIKEIVDSIDIPKLSRNIGIQQRTEGNHPGEIAHEEYRKALEKIDPETLSQKAQELLKEFNTAEKNNNHISFSLGEEIRERIKDFKYRSEASRVISDMENGKTVITGNSGIDDLCTRFGIPTDIPDENKVKHLTERLKRHQELQSVVVELTTSSDTGRTLTIRIPQEE